MDIDRVLRNTPATLTVTFYGDETPVDADAGVTVLVKRADGSTLATGNATHVGAAGSGQYSYSLVAQPNLNNLTIDWSGTFSGAAGTIRTYVEIVGGFYFTLSELRAYDASLADPAKYPTQKLIDIRTTVEVEFERICNRAFVRRYGRETIEGDGTDGIWLTHPDVAEILTVNGEDVSANTYKGDGLRFVRWPYNVWVKDTSYTIEYEYGMQPTPPDIKTAALRRARGLLVSGRSRIDERATVMQIPDFGTFNLATPGKAGSYTGIPDVDVVLQDYMLGGGGVL